MAKPLSAARFSFGLKFLTAAVVVVFANVMAFDYLSGITIGLIALTWAVGLGVALPGMRRNWLALAALIFAILFSVALMDDYSVLGWILFWVSMASAALLARRDLGHALQLLLLLLVHAIVGLGAPLRDLVRLMRVPRPGLRSSLLSLAAMLGLPIVGGAIFIALFASANPIVDSLVPSFTLPALSERNFWRLMFAGLVFVAVWPNLRPSRVALTWEPQAPEWRQSLPGVSVLSMILSLIMFNAIFAVENALDVAFLWSGAPLPHGVTMAQYAHRGAYPLIATALLAGAFVLFTARPDTEIGRNRLIRMLVVGWIAQNLVLVASSVIRTLDYIGAYMLTSLRIAALVWMGLVAVGLALICWRMVAARSLSWLINAIAISAFAVLTVSTVVDYGTVAAEWNVRHAREAGGEGQSLDMFYMRSLGPSAMVALAWLETQPNLDDDFRERVTLVRHLAMNGPDIGAEAITWRNRRRLAAVSAILGPSPRVPFLSWTDMLAGNTMPRAPLTPPASQ